LRGWTPESLPYNAEYGLPVSTPKPDLHTDTRPATRPFSTWSPKENLVVDHMFARPYTQPARGNKFPFLVFELKLESTGGTLWHAENQAAAPPVSVGSGGCSRRQIKLNPLPIVSRFPSRQLKEPRFSTFTTMSLKTTDTTCRLSIGSGNTDTADIQRCHGIIKNILKWGAESRQKRNKKSKTLFLVFTLSRATGVCRGVVIPFQPVQDLVRYLDVERKGPHEVVTSLLTLRSGFDGSSYMRI
jgi:hypothetical protein